MNHPRARERTTSHPQEGDAVNSPTPQPVIHRDGHGPLWCYPDQRDPSGLVSRNWGTHGATWCADGRAERGIFTTSDGFTARPDTQGCLTRTYKTLRGALSHMARHGLDSYGRPLTTAQEMR